MILVKKKSYKKSQKILSLHLPLKGPLTIPSELLLILDEYWSEHPELHDVPIYYASSLAKKCMLVYQTYTDAMNHSIRKQMNKRNPFKFKHITNLKSIEQFDDQVPSVVLGISIT